MTMKMTIERSRWGRHLLYNSDTKKLCCLGFLGLVSGLTPEDMDHIGSPFYVEQRTDLKGKAKWPQGLIERDDNSVICNQLIKVNDYGDDSDREVQIKTLFKILDVDVEFAG
jgi:hypothetical protein